MAAVTLTIGIEHLSRDTAPGLYVTAERSDDDTVHHWGPYATTEEAEQNLDGVVLFMGGEIFTTFGSC